MSASVDAAFISQFEDEVKAAYQRMGSKLTNTVRRKDNVKGKDTTFQKVGKGTAGKKSRHGKVPLMNIDHTPVKVTLEDWYAGDFIDKLDELKTNIDEKAIIVEAGAAAMGRKSDELLVTVASASVTNPLVAAGGTGLTQAKVTNCMELFGTLDIPDDGQRYFQVDPRCWGDLLGITAFSSADFVPAGELPYSGGMVAKRWLGFMITPFSGLLDGAAGATEARNLAYHKTALGFASGQEIAADITWQGQEQAHFVAYSMSQGAVVIDGVGIQVVDAVR